MDILDDQPTTNSPDTSNTMHEVNTSVQAGSCHCFMSALLVEDKKYETEVCDWSGHGSPMARTRSASPMGPSSPRQVESAPLTRVHSSDSQSEGQQSPKSQAVTPRRQISPARSGALSSAMFSISEDRPSTNAELQQLRHEIAEAKVSSTIFHFESPSFDHNCLFGLIVQGYVRRHWRTFEQC